MESAEPAGTVAALQADLASKSYRIAQLEARISLLETEIASLRRAMAKGEVPDLRGEKDPTFRQLKDVSGGHKQTAAGKFGGDEAYCVVVLSDGEEGVAADATKGISPEVGVAAAPIPTPRKHAVRVVTGELEGGSESSKGEDHCDINPWLDDDDVLVTPRGKKRARVVTSDSEDEDANGGELGHANAYRRQAMGASPSRNRALRGIVDWEEDGNEGAHVANLERASCLLMPETESEDEDDRIPISQVLKKIRKQKASDAAADDFSDAKGCSTPATRRSARLVKNQSKKGQTARRVLSFVEPKEYERSDNDSEEDDDDMDDFINDGNSSEHASGSADESCSETEVSDASAPDEELPPELEDSDGEISYADVMASIGRKRKTQDWKFEGEMLAAFDEHPELCLKAVCALYRRQTEEEQREKATIVHNKEGFSQIDAPRASCIAEYLLDGDLYGPLKKSIGDLEGYDRFALEFCRKVASRYSKQLFTIYQNKEDPYFHP